MLALSRNAWRQLTSMRTALVLLFLLAIAAVPGSLLPQRAIAVEKVAEYRAAHPSLAPWLDRFGFFDVYASPWFSAIYLLLFLSLVGCLVPRLRAHYAALVRVPPDAPANLDRLPAFASGLPSRSVPELAAMLRARRFRVAVRDNTVSAEKGYLKETGNLLFHFALLAILSGVAYGSWYGWHGNRLLIAGEDRAFCSSLVQFDERGLGARVSERDVPRFCLRLDDFRASYLDNGQPTSFAADMHVRVPGRVWDQTVQVNAPLRLDRANVYLLGHGYAPVIRYTDRYGQSQTTVAPFLPSDQMLTSDGAALFPDVNINPATGKRDERAQVGFAGVYLPTAPDDPLVGQSAFPAEREPRLMVQPYVGDLGLDAGVPKSVYRLDQRQISTGRLVKAGDPMMLRPGGKASLPDGSTVEFLGTRQWVSLSVRYNPGEPIILGGAVALLLGLIASLTGRRRRIWFRVGESTVEAGGLPRSEYSGFAEEFDDIVKAVGAAPLPGEERRDGRVVQPVAGRDDPVVPGGDAVLRS